MINADIYCFHRVVKKCMILISNVLKGNVVIPEFKEFCDDIEELYEK